MNAQQVQQYLYQAVPRVDLSLYNYVSDRSAFISPASSWEVVEPSLVAHESAHLILSESYRTQRRDDILFEAVRRLDLFTPFDVETAQDEKKARFTIPEIKVRRKFRDLKEYKLRSRYKFQFLVEKLVRLVFAPLKINLDSLHPIRLAA